MSFIRFNPKLDYKYRATKGKKGFISVQIKYFPLSDPVSTCFLPPILYAIHKKKR